MSINTASWTEQNWLQAAPACGLPSANFVKSAAAIAKAQSVAQNSIPPGAPSDFATVCWASLVARGIIYFKSNPGDCPTQSPIGLSNAQLTGIAGGLAGAGISIGTAAAGIASMAGSVLPGIQVAVSAISVIFAAHAQAVANEQQTICSVANIVNQVFAFYDVAVLTGKLSPTTAYSGMQTYLSQVNGQLETIEKTCNAACVYQGILKAHAVFVQYYYPAIAPSQLSVAAPGAAPIKASSPGGVISTGTSPSVWSAPPAPKLTPGQFVQQSSANGVTNTAGELLQVEADGSLTPLTYAQFTALGGKGTVYGLNLTGYKINSPSTGNPKNYTAIFAVAIAAVAGLLFFTSKEA